MLESRLENASGEIGVGTRKAEHAKPIGRLRLLSKVAAGNRELMGLSLRIAGTTLPLHARSI